ncbi:phospholipase A1 2 [Eurosta solidaginis]|uniref:phospholipase A1 2 n=1 Tax=Eurosta solidaginis TaxID=178769 RepID=UPI003530DA80
MREVRATFHNSVNQGTRQIFMASLVVIVLVLLTTNAPYAYSAPLSSSLRDSCGHTFHRPTSYFARHFDTTFMKRIAGHLNPFTSAAPVRMRFFLYKSDFAECGREIITNDYSSLQMSEFNAKHPTRIIIHGWMSKSKGALNRLLTKAYLSLVKRVPAPTVSDSHSDIADYPMPIININDDNNNNNDGSYRSYVNNTTTNTPNDYNVIICDWTPTSSNVNYFAVADMVKDVGHLLAEFVKFLHLRADLDYNDVYLIGHSLGAQIAGSAGKQSYPFRFNTIFALDPAGPKFRDQSPENRIDASDAEYVESIQTSSSFGFKKPLGHAAFYPNYGHSQKKCYFYGCSHKRAYHYFAESITSKLGFWGVPCRRTSNGLWIFTQTAVGARMGGEPSLPKNGTFYVKTADQPPYALGPTILSQQMVIPAIDEASNENLFEM